MFTSHDPTFIISIDHVDPRIAFNESRMTFAIIFASAWFEGIERFSIYKLFSKVAKTVFLSGIGYFVGFLGGIRGLDVGFLGATTGFDVGFLGTTTGFDVGFLGATTGTLVGFLGAITGTFVGFLGATTGTLVGFLGATTGTFVGFLGETAGLNCADT
jgi:hypothetical protein